MRNRLLGAVSAAMVLAAGTMLVPVQAAGPEFEVANITPAPPPTPDLFRSGKIHIGMTVDRARVDIGGLPLTTLIQQAYRVKPFQVVAPAWAGESRWDILAKLPDGGSTEKIPEMLQALLADRFKLTVHHDQHEQPVYELVVAKGGPKLEAADPSDGADGAAADGAAADGAKDTGAPGLFPGPFGGLGGGGNVAINGDGRGGGGRGAVITGGAGGTTRITPNGGCGMRLEFSQLTMPALVDTLTTFLDKPVVDATGLKGTYKVGLNLPMEVMLAMMQNMVKTAGLPFGGPGGPGGDGGGRGGPGGDGGGRGGFGGGPGGQPGCPDPGAALAGGDASTAPIFQAVQQLGLKLQARKAPFETIVVDRLEKTPTEN